VDVKEREKTMQLYNCTIYSWTMAGDSPYRWHGITINIKTQTMQSPPTQQQQQQKAIIATATRIKIPIEFKSIKHG